MRPESLSPRRLDIDWDFQEKPEALFASKCRQAPPERTESIGVARKGVLRDRINEVHTVQKPKISAVKGVERPALSAVKSDKTPTASRTNGKSFFEPSSLSKAAKAGSERQAPKPQAPAQTMVPDEEESPARPEEPSAKHEEFTMTADEEKVYGKRFIAGFERVRLLGRGGQALVWLGRRASDQQLFAVKQIALSAFVSEKGAMKEVELSEKIFEEEEAEEHLAAIGKKSIVRVIDCRRSNKDVFLVLDLGGPCLSKLVYSMKGEFVKSERVYGVGAADLDHARPPVPGKPQAVPSLPQARHAAAGRTPLALNQEHRALRLEAREHPDKVQAGHRGLGGSENNRLRRLVHVRRAAVPHRDHARVPAAGVLAAVF